MPEFQAQTTKGIINFPKDYKGKWVILFSHPADYTPVCTSEFVAFAKRYEKFKELNADLIGLSIDQVFSHIKLTFKPKGMVMEIWFGVLPNDHPFTTDINGDIIERESWRI